MQLDVDDGSIAASQSLDCIYTGFGQLYHCDKSV